MTLLKTGPSAIDPARKSYVVAGWASVVVGV